MVCFCSTTIERSTCHSLVACSTSCQALLRSNHGQVVHTIARLLSSGIIWQRWKTEEDNGRLCSNRRVLAFITLGVSSLSARDRETSTVSQNCVSGRIPPNLQHTAQLGTEVKKVSGQGHDETRYDGQKLVC